MSIFKFLKRFIPSKYRFKIWFWLRKKDKEKLIASAYLPSDPIVLEAGAHIGYDTVGICKVWKNCTVHAFEPVATIREELLKQTRFLKNVHVYPFALSEKTGEETIYLSSGGQNASSSLLKPKEHIRLYPDVRFESNQQVRTWNLDEWAIEYQVEKIDFMWLDMQGKELAVLRASPRIFATVSVVYIEVHRLETYEQVPKYQEVKDFMHANGFKLLLEDMAYEEGGNAMFVRMPNSNVL